MTETVRELTIHQGVSIKLPDHPIASSIFSSMVVVDCGEWRSFLETAQGCSNLVDLGASAGFFSALFAATRESSARILSVEFDKNVLPVLEQTRTLNLKPGINWIIDSRGVSDVHNFLGVVSSGFGAEVEDEYSRVSAHHSAQSNRMQPEEYEVEVDQLSSICGSYDFAPDLLKIDVEGYEFEVILSSQEILNKYKPKIHLELHLDLLRRRGKELRDILSLLDKVGYRLPGSAAALSGLGLEQIPSGLIRLGLTVQAPDHLSVSPM